MSPRIARPLLSVTAEDDMPAAERKRLQKEAEAKVEAEDNAKKQAEKALQAGKQEAAGAKEENVEELEDPTKYRENRMATVKAWKTPYPHKWPVDASIPGLIEKYKDMPAAAGQGGRGAAPRLQNQRNQGASVLFSDLWADGSKIQVVAQVQFHEVGDFKDERCKINHGDIIGARGSSGKSKKRSSYQKPPGRHRARLAMPFMWRPAAAVTALKGTMLLTTSAAVAWARDRDVDDHRRSRSTLDRHLADLHLDAAVSFEEDGPEDFKGNTTWVQVHHLADGSFGRIDVVEPECDPSNSSSRFLPSTGIAESFVKKLFRSSMSKSFVMKTPKSPALEDSEELEREIETMTDIKELAQEHPLSQKYVMLLEDSGKGPPPFYVAEQMAGSLADFGLLSETCLTEFVRELVEMLDYFHDKLEYVHFDIKADNILYTGTTSGWSLFGLLGTPDKCPRGLRLSDFGGTQKVNSLHNKGERSLYFQQYWKPAGVFDLGQVYPKSVEVAGKPSEFMMTKDIDLCGAAVLLREKFHHSFDPVQKFADELFSEEVLTDTVDCGLMGWTYSIKLEKRKPEASNSN